MKKGKIIVIEGACDGIGKTTQFNMLKERLEKNNEIVISHHFPSYNTYYGAPVEKFLQGEFGRPQDNSPYFVHMLYATDRAIAWRKELRQEYNQGNTILLDRYTTSSMIYQSTMIDDLDKKKEFLDYVSDLEFGKLEIGRPDKVIFLTAPFDLVTRLKNERTSNEGYENDAFEREWELMRKIYDNSTFVAKYENWDIIDCANENGMKSIEEIHEKIYQKVKTL